MSFLGLAFLAALPLAAAPLLLHFFDRRRDQVIAWGAMQFLTEASTRKTSSRRLKQLLLLCLRVLAVAALVLALARPLVPSWLLGESGQGETIFVFDNSLSMQRVVGESNYLQEAIEVAIEELDQLPANEHIRVLAAAPYATWLSAQSPNSAKRTINEAQELIRNVAESQASSDLLSALFSAIQLEPDTAHSSRRIVVLTDGQNTDWRLEDRVGWEKLHEALVQSEIQTEFQVIRMDERIAAASGGNRAIDHLTVDRFLTGVAQPLNITAHIQNYEDAPLDGHSLVWEIDGKEFDQQVTSPLEASGALQWNWTHSFSEPGIYHVRCRIDAPDTLPGDDHADLVVEVVEQIPIVIVEGNFGGAEMQQDAYFVEAALGWSDGAPSDAHSIYQPTVVAPEELSTIDLSEQRVVVIPNMRQLDADLVSRLADFVADGGGLWIGVGPRTDSDAFNHLLYADASGLSPLRLDRIVGGLEPATAEDGGETTPLRIDPFRVQHPASAHLTDDNSLDLRDTVVDRYFQFSKERLETTTSLLMLSNGHPLAIENRVGQGRVILQSIPLRMQWSNLARTQAFVVMVRDWVDYLAQPRSTQFNLQPGEPIVYRRSATDSAPNSDDAPTQLASPTALLTMPSGEATELTSDTFRDRYEFRSSRTRTPGLYRLTIGLEESGLPYSVRRSSAESKLVQLTTANAQQIDQALTVSPSEVEPSAAAGQSNPLWPYLLIGLILVLAGELFLSGMLSRERFGTGGIPDHSEVGTPVIGESSDLAVQANHNAWHSSAARPPAFTPSEGHERV